LCRLAEIKRLAEFFPFFTVIGDSQFALVFAVGFAIMGA